MFIVKCNDKIGGRMCKNVLITGGSRGIGAAMVEKFTSCGYKVIFFYEKNKTAADMIACTTGAIPFQCDLGDVENLDEVMKSAKKEAGCDGFDIIICNAGISSIGLFDTMEHDEWNRIMNVNINGNAAVVKSNLPYMISNKEGSVVMISSMWGQTGASCEVAYSTSKAAVIGFTKSLAKEVAPSGIRVNCVAPGLINTDMNKNLSIDIIRELEEEIPMQRIGTGEEVAEAVYFLALDSASYITGQVLGVNGGFIC